MYVALMNGCHSGKGSVVLHNEGTQGCTPDWEVGVAQHLLKHYKAFDVHVCNVHGDGFDEWRSRGSRVKEP